VRGNIGGTPCRALADAVSDAVVGVDATGRITWLNSAAERLFGPVDDVQGRPFATLGVSAAATIACEDGGSVVVIAARGSSSRRRDLAHDLGNVFAVVTTYTSLVLRQVDAARSGDAVDWAAVRRDLEAVAEAASEGIALCGNLVEER
jgi:PAS domain-containing protein